MIQPLEVVVLGRLGGDSSRHAAPVDLSMRRSLVEAAKKAAAEPSVADASDDTKGSEAGGVKVLHTPKVVSLCDLRPGGKVLGLIQEVAEVRACLHGRVD